MNHSDIEHMSQGYPPSHIGKDCEEVITWLATQLLATQEQRDALAVLAEERRQFIVNGVEMGDILLPVIDGDPAIGIHERCLLKPKFAYEAYLNSVRADGVDMAVNELKDLAQRSESESPIAAEHNHGAALYLMLFANQLRAGETS